MNTVDHELSYVEDVTRKMNASVNDDGDITLDEGYVEVIDVHENSLWCSICGRLGYDEYEDHGISEEWQVV